MQHKRLLIGLICAFGLAPACQSNDGATDVNTPNADQNTGQAESFQINRTGWGHHQSGAGGQAGGLSGTAGASGSPDGGVATGATGGSTATGATGGGTATGATGGSAAGSSSGNMGSSAPASGTCGNGAVEPSESCDGSAMQSATCAALGFAGGSLKCSSGCQFDASGCTGGTLTPSVTASRTSCAAPCGVFFDATATTGLSASDYVGASWDWDFNDPSSPHKGTIGFLAAHVFDKPGTYKVTTRVHDLAGAAGMTTTTITVSAMSGTTYYVSSSGSDSAAGTSTSAPFLTLAHAVGLATTNGSILLRRGDTFSGLSSVTLSTPGPLLIGAYTDPAHTSTAAPILTTSATAMFNPTASDIRMTDLHVKSTSSGLCSVGSTNTLIERVEGEGFTTVIVGIQQSALNTFVVDSTMHGFNGYFVYADRSSHAAIIGNSATAFGGGEEGLRMQGGSDSVGTSGQFTTATYVAENTIQFTDPSTSGGQEAYTFRGDNQNTVFIGNVANHYVSFAPQNASGAGSNEHVKMVLADGNLIANAGAPGDLFDAMVVTAQHVTIRNNILVTPIIGIVVTGETGGLLSPANFVDNITIVNNTMYTYPTVGSAPYQGYNISLVAHQNTPAPGGLVVQNNILSEGALSSASAILSTDHTGSDTFDHNLIYAPNATLGSSNVGASGVSANPQFVSTTVGTASAFTLGSGSPARNAGANTHVYQDHDAVPRPAGSAIEMGSFQYKP